MKFVRVLSLMIVVLGSALRLEAATATWDRNTESTVTGYRLSYGTQSGNHTTSVDVGNVVTYQFFPPAGQRYYVVVQAYDNTGTLSAESAEVIYDAPAANLPPVLGLPANQTSVQNTAVSLALVASDPNGTPVTFSATGLPPGLTVNAATGVISGTVTTTGTYAVTATASDGSLAASQAFSWTVTQANRAPVFTQPANQTSAEGAAISLALSASDPNGNPLTFSAAGLPNGLTSNASTGAITGTLATGSAGPNTVTATVSDGSLTASVTFTWTVSAGSAPVTVTLSPADTSISIDSTNYSGDQRLEAHTWPAYKVATAILMKFDVSQIPANAIVQSAVLQLALIKTDGTASDPNYNVSLHQVINRNPDITRATGMTADGVTGWTPNTCCNQNIPLAQADLSPARAVTSVDLNLGVKTWDATALVQAWRSAPATNFGLALNADTSKGNERYRQFASAEYPTVSQRPVLRITYTLPSADTTAPAVAITGPSNGSTVLGSAVAVTATATDAVGVAGVQFKLDGANIGSEDTSAPYSINWDTTSIANGTHVLTAVARDAAANSATSASVTVTVSNPVPNRAPSLTQPANQTTAEGSAAALTLVASDPDGNPLTFSASGLPGGLTLNASTGVISGTPSFTSAGVYTVTATVSDGQLSQSRTFTWTIANTNRGPAFTQPANQTAAEGAAVSLALSASDADGDALTFSATGLPAGLVINASTGVISGAPTYTSAGAYTVTATVTDGSLSQGRTFSWTITDTNRAPVIARPADQFGTAGSSVVLAMSASDPDGQAVTYQATGLPVALTINAATGVISGVLDPSSAGVYTVTVTATDGSLVDGVTFTWSIDNSDAPVRGDFDGDGRDDPATYRASTGEWRVWLSVNGFTLTSPIVWGGADDITVPADYDGDHRTDIAVYRPATGTWHVLLSSTGMQSSLDVQWGDAGDRPVAFDYDGDGKADLALPRFGGFEILLSRSNYGTSVFVR